jgi:methionyl-tRNA formyltransferase
MRIAFAGTAPFAAQVLARVAGGRHPVVVCITSPDKPRGRHGTPQPSPLKVAAAERDLPVLQPVRLDDAFTRELAAFDPEVFVACAYGVIVPAAVFESMLSLVVHPSPVPRWRGAAPVVRALMAGETEMGVATLRMTAGVDEGPVADARAVHVPRVADTGEAYALLAAPAAQSLLATLDAIEAGTVVWIPQTGEASYAEKLTDADRTIDWACDAQAIADRVRALSPEVGAVTELGGRRVLLWKAAVAQPPAAADTRDRLVIACGEGWLEVLELQEEGRRRITAQEYLRGAGRRLAQA